MSISLNSTQPNYGKSLSFGTKFSITKEAKVSLQNTTEGFYSFCSPKGREGHFPRNWSFDKFLQGSVEAFEKATADIGGTLEIFMGKNISEKKTPQLRFISDKGEIVDSIGYRDDSLIPAGFTISKSTEKAALDLVAVASQMFWDKRHCTGGVNPFRAKVDELSKKLYGDIATSYINLPR